jgi:hypothetical protein
MFLSDISSNPFTPADKTPEDKSLDASARQADIRRVWLRIPILSFIFKAYVILSNGGVYFLHSR